MFIVYFALAWIAAYLIAVQFVSDAMYPFLVLFFALFPPIAAFLFTMFASFKEDHLSWKYLFLIPFALISVLLTTI
ncbi:MAG TPA: hypothetical protein OIM03_01390 [Veillonellaceae bacterium]|nr:hypothetical protein [Veillonellaceae bacterium]